MLRSNGCAKFPNGRVEFLTVSRENGKPRKMRAVFYGNHVRQADLPHEVLHDYTNAFSSLGTSSRMDAFPEELEWVDMQRGADDEVALTAYSSVLAVSAAQGSELGVGTQTQMPYPSTRDV